MDPLTSIKCLTAGPPTAKGKIGGIFEGHATQNSALLPTGNSLALCHSHNPVVPAPHFLQDSFRL